MSKTRQEKEQIVEALAELLKEMKGAAFASVHGYNMADADKMRAKGREAGVKFAVAKKTLLKRAVEKAEIKDFDPTQLEGSVLLAMGMSDEVAAAKLVAELVESKEEMQILGGILEGSLIEVAEVKHLAKLPSKLELQAKLVGTLNAPISGFVNVLAGNIRGLVTVLNAIKDAKA